MFYGSLLKGVPDASFAWLSSLSDVRGSGMPLVHGSGDLSNGFTRMMEARLEANGTGLVCLGATYFTAWHSPNTAWLSARMVSRDVHLSPRADALVPS